MGQKIYDDFHNHSSKIRALQYNFFNQIYFGYTAGQVK